MGGREPSSGPSAGPSDASLAERAARGDAGAYGELYERHAPALRPWAFRWSDSEPAGEDLLQDVFLEAWSALRAFDPQRGSFRTWMFARLRSRAIDRRRASAREGPPSMTSADETPAPGPDPSVAVERAEVREWLLGMPESMRGALRMVYFEGRSAAEVAELLGEPLGTVKSRIFRALGRLRAQHGEEDA